MSKAKFNKLTKLDKEIEELKRKQQEAKEATFFDIGEQIFKNWNLEENDDYDLLSELIKDKAQEFDQFVNGKDTEFTNEQTQNENNDQHKSETY